MIVLRRVLQGALILALLVLPGCNSRNSEYSLLFAGDIMLARSGTGLYPISASAVSPWGDLLEVRKNMADSLFVANLESPLGNIAVPVSKPINDMNLCTSVEAAAILQEVDLNLVTYANNHASDCAQVDTDLTYETLQQNGISGLSGDTDFVYELKSGRKISFIAVNDYSDAYDLAAIKRKINAAKLDNQLVIISIHWGMEYQAGPAASQEQLAIELVDAGVDIIWGHHPHVLQKMEWIQSSIDGHTALVMYSLGNLVADQWMVPDAQQTAVIRVEFRGKEITAVTVVPLVMDFKSKALQYADNQAAESIADRLKMEGLTGREVKISTWLKMTTP